MQRNLYLSAILSRRTRAQEARTRNPSAVIAFDLGPLTNTIRLAQYQRKRAIKNANPHATFPLEVYG